MDTKVIKGISPLTNDNEILLALQNKSDRNLGGNRMTVGVRNDARQIYRTVDTNGLTGFMAVIGVFENFAMVDELQHEDFMRDGCDAIFSNP